MPEGVEAKWGHRTQGAEIIPQPDVPRMREKEGGVSLIPLRNRSERSERQIATHLPSGPPEAGGRGQRGREGRGGAAHILRMKGRRALAVERQEPGHFLPEAGGKTDRRTALVRQDRTGHPKASLGNLQAAAITLPWIDPLSQSWFRPLCLDELERGELWE